jgi:two-component system sensor histidine kinase SenX3
MLESFARRSSAPEFLVVARLSDGELRYGEGLASMATTQFPRMLAHLRLGYSQAFFEEARTRYRNSLLSTLLSILVGGAIGAGALAARITADRRREELAVRQREFATRVTHELKTPLAGIRVMAENIELGSADDPAVARAFARRILTESDKLTARIDEILAVARTRTPARPQQYDIEALLDGALDEWEPRFEDAGVELIRDLEPVGTAFGDPALMRDAMVCLLDNAIKYKRDDRQSVVQVNLRSLNDQAELSVSDNGIGVPKRKREDIFQLFVRVEGPDRGLSGGHGLGLSFVNDAVESQKGSVRCEEGIAGGARFVLRLPIQH